MLTLIELSDVKWKPRAKLELAGPLGIGTRIRLRFQLRQQNQGRTEILVVNGEFRVAAVGLDASSGAARQVLSLDSVGTVPTWRAVKKTPSRMRSLPPAKAPKTILT